MTTLRYLVLAFLATASLVAAKPVANFFITQDTIRYQINSSLNQGVLSFDAFPVFTQINISRQQVPNGEGLGVALGITDSTASNADPIDVADVTYIDSGTINGLVIGSDASSFSVFTGGTNFDNVRLVIAANGEITISNLSGSGNAQLCVDSGGKLYRGSPGC